MIESFKHKGLKKLFVKGETKQVRPDLVEKIEDILATLNVAETTDELDLPGYRLHRLTGNLRGFWSVTVSRNYRIIFRFMDGSAHDVDLNDYH